MNSKIKHQTMSIALFERELLHSGVTKRTARQYARKIKTTIDKHGFISYKIASDTVYNIFSKYSAAAANKYASAFKAYSKVCKLGWEDQLKRYKETPAPKRQPDIELGRKIIDITPENTRDDIVHNKYSILFELMFLTGMRLVEARSLKTNNISDSEIILERTKTGAGRRIATPPFKKFQSKLFEYIDNNNSLWAFPTEKDRSKHVSDAACRKEFSNRLKRLGIKYKYTPHTFRGAFMTRNLRNGAVLFDVQDIVGHTSADTTKMYYRGGIEAQKELMKNDPANVTRLSAQEQFDQVVEILRKSGIFKRDNISYKITEDSICIEITDKK